MAGALQAIYDVMRPQQEADGTENWVTGESYNDGGGAREPSMLALARTGGCGALTCGRVREEAVSRVQRGDQQGLWPSVKGLSQLVAASCNIHKGAEEHCTVTNQQDLIDIHRILCPT